MLALQAGSTDDGAFAGAQERLNRRYDDYVARYGPISRFTSYETGGTDVDSGEAIFGRRNPKLGGFRTDPDFPSLLALEVFDPETQTASKAAIFSERVVGPREVRGRADSPEEAVTICLDETGSVTLRTCGRPPRHRHQPMPGAASAPWSSTTRRVTSSSPPPGTSRATSG